MGRVWVARDTSAGGSTRLVAIKTSLGDDDGGREFWNVLLDEARIASQVQHPNVCAIHAFEVDEARNIPYLVMDWSDGGSLHELLAERPDHRIELLLAARIALLVCDALQAAHELADQDGVLLGVVHRDVSPQNILISSTGQVRLTDFGVAKARGRLHAATETGEVKGKLSYMAPEQVTSKNADRRADVFALGCVLYEATTGERPFHGDDAVSTLYQLLEQPLTLPSARLPGYPVELERIVFKALEREAQNRYQSAEEMGAALAGWIASQGILVTERELSTLVRETLGKRIAARQVQIASVENDLDVPAPVTLPGEETLSGSATGKTPNVPAAARRSRAVPFAAAGIAALALVGWMALSHNRRADPKVGAEPSVGAPLSSAPSAPSAPSAAPSADITLTLRAEPAEAVLYLDEGSALPNPYQLVVRADRSNHHLRAVAPGFAERVEPLTFDHSKEVVVALSGRAAQPSTPGSKHPKPAVPPVPSARKPGDVTVTKKAPRTLDTDNPFAVH
jgi:serine/threonine-protein kinase